MSSGEKEIHHPDGRIERADVRYEEKDVRFGCILALLIAAGCILVTLLSLIWYLFRAEQRIQAESKQSPYPLAPFRPSPCRPNRGWSRSIAWSLDRPKAKGSDWRKWSDSFTVPGRLQKRGSCTFPLRKR